MEVYRCFCHLGLNTTETPTRLDMARLRIRPRISELFKCLECFKVHPSLSEGRIGLFLVIYWKQFAKESMKTDNTMEMCSKWLRYPGYEGNSAQGSGKYIYICVYAYVKIKTKLNIQFRSGCLFPAQCDTPKYPILGYLKWQALCTFIFLVHRVSLYKISPTSYRLLHMITIFKAESHAQHILPSLFHYANCLCSSLLGTAFETSPCLFTWSGALAQLVSQLPWHSWTPAHPLSRLLAWRNASTFWDWALSGCQIKKALRSLLSLAGSLLSQLLCRRVKPLLRELW